MSKHAKFGLTLAYIDNLNIPNESKDILKGLVKEVKCEAFDFGYNVKVAGDSNVKSEVTIGCVPKQVIKDLIREVLREQRIVSSCKSPFDKGLFETTLQG